MKNKRRTARVSCLVPVDGQEGGTFDNLRTVDISKTGIGFVSQKKIPLNKKIAIELDLNGDESVFVIGRVKYVRPIAQTQNYRIGLSFTDVPSGNKSRLNKYFSNTGE